MRIDRVFVAVRLRPGVPRTVLAAFLLVFGAFAWKSFMAFLMSATLKTAVVRPPLAPPVQ
jgi:hypothetical protein